MSGLTPLRCAACGGVVPLAAAESVDCPYCSASVPVPADYLEAAKLRERERTVRQDAAPLWLKVASGVSPVVEYGALTAVALLPPAGAIAANLGSEWSSQGDVMSFVALPLLLPGAGVFLWASAVNETTLGVRAALGARPGKEEGAPLGCRSCGAPLDVPPEALFVTCLYCETDNLREVMPLGQLAQDLRQTLKSLRDAVGALRKRRRLLALGSLGLTLAVAAISTLLAFAVRATL